jgi:DNA-binding ferritin-like protein (Dps family)
MEKETKKKERKLNLRQERFCQLYASSEEFFMNGVKSYSKAYNKPIKTLKEYNVCKAGAYENLTKPNILERIDELIEEANLNDSFVDKQLGNLITQEVDFKSKLGAIREYNKLKQRIEEKHKHDVSIISLSSLFDKSDDEGK